MEEQQKKPSGRNRPEEKAQKKPDFKKIKNTTFLVAFILLGIYYFYLRFQEQQAMQQAPSTTVTLATAAPVQQTPGATATPAGTQKPSSTQKPVATTKPTASPSDPLPSAQSIPFELAGSNGEKRYDSNGNLIDTSNFLVSVHSSSEVLPKGFSFQDFPSFSGQAVVIVNNNVPFFTPEEIALAKQGTFEYYGELDSRGRCTVAFDCLGKDTMPAYGQKRGSISSIHPTGWKQARYDCVDSETVMTRAHLAGYMLSSENANPNNLITGTRYMNADTMLPYEESTADYLDHHSSGRVLYRVTPCFRGSNLMAEGILMEAMSVEDLGKSHQYCVFVYNIQPGLNFRYSNGASSYVGIFFDVKSDTVVTDGLKLKTYGMEFSTQTIHTKNCSKYNALPASDKASFYGDSAMKSEWPSLGYHFCSCMQ